jgi:small subunit ribosomal protein S8
MSMTDPVADMLTRLRNASRAGHARVEMPSSKLKEGIAKILKEEGFIRDYSVKSDNKQGILTLVLRYAGGEPVLIGLKRISKPGRRIYSSKDDLPVVRGGLGMAIISTSKGLMTDAAAREMGVGGEVICSVW